MNLNLWTVQKSNFLTARETLVFCIFIFWMAWQLCGITFRSWSCHELYFYSYIYLTKFSIYLFIHCVCVCYCVCVCVWVWVCTCHHIHVKIRGQLAGVSSPSTMLVPEVERSSDLVENAFTDPSCWPKWISLKCQLMTSHTSKTTTAQLVEFDLR